MTEAVLPGEPLPDFDRLAGIVQDAVRASALSSAGHHRSGPFVIRYRDDWTIPGVNYAIPDAAAEPTADEVRELIEAFAALDRLPRLELVPQAAPAVEYALLDAGFVPENRAPLLACLPGPAAGPEGGRLVPPTGGIAGITLRAPRDEAELVQAATVQHFAYGETGDLSPGSVTWLRDTPRRGGFVAVAVAAVAAAADGENGADAASGNGAVTEVIIGVGACTPATDGICELVGMAVDEAYRRRGIAAALTAYLTRTMFENGRRVVWLEPADEAAERLYIRLGYRWFGEKLNISMPAGDVPESASAG